jgi:hypothetical protein
MTKQRVRVLLLTYKKLSESGLSYTTTTLDLGDCRKCLEERAIIMFRLGVGRVKPTSYIPLGKNCYEEMQKRQSI